MHFKDCRELERLILVGEELGKESTSRVVVVLTVIIIVSGGIAADVRG